MPEIKTNDSMNWVDVARRLDPDGNTDMIVEAMSKMYPVLNDMPMQPSNMPTSHKGTIRTGLPEIVGRALDKGVPNSKSTTKQVQFDCALREGRSHTDKELLKLTDDPNGVRFSEQQAFFESMGQDLATLFWYGNSIKDPLQYMGLSYYYSDPSKASARNIIDAGGTTTGALSSLWLCAFQPNVFHGLYAKNTKAGIEHEDLGQQEVLDKDGRRYSAMEDKYVARPGLCMKDWRQAARIANIDTQTLLNNPSDAVAEQIVNKAVVAKNRIHNLNTGYVFWYCPGDILTVLEQQAINKKNAALSYVQTQNDTTIVKLLGYPIRRDDVLTPTEDRIVF